MKATTISPPPQTEKENITKTTAATTELVAAQITATTLPPVSELAAIEFIYLTKI